MRKVVRGITCTVLVYSSLPNCSCKSDEHNHTKIGQKRSRAQQSQAIGGDELSAGRILTSFQRTLELQNAREYEMPIKHLQLLHHQVNLNGQTGEGLDTLPSPTAVRDSQQDSSHSIIEFSTSVSVPSFILQYRMNSATPPSSEDYESIANHTRIFITEQLEKKLNRRGIKIAEKSFSNIRGGTNKSEYSVEVVFVPVFLFDSTWSKVPSEIELDKFLIALFSGQSLVEYTSSLRELDKGSAFAATTSVVFRRSQEPKLHPDAQESVNAPYFAGACAGIITLLILFLWNQSMRVRSLMKHKATGIEAETLFENERRYRLGCGDEEQGHLDPTNSGNRWDTCSDVSKSDCDCGLDESLTQDAFHSPLFSYVLDLENSSGSSSTCESETANQIVKPSSRCNKRWNVSNKSTDSGPCLKSFDDACSSSADESNCNRIDVTSSPMQLFPSKKAQLNSIFGTECDFEKPESSKTSEMIASENISSYCSSDEFDEVEACNSFEQLSRLQNRHSTLDSIFGTVQDYQKFKPRKKSIIKKCDELSGDGNYLLRNQPLGVMKHNSFEQQSGFENGQIPKESTVWADDDNKRNNLRNNISSDDFGYGSDYSLIDSSSGSEFCISKVDSSEEKEEATDISLCECSQSRECQDCLELVAPKLSKKKKTRLHAWLINQGQSKYVLCSRSDSLMDRHTKERKQEISSVSYIDEKCQVNTPIGAELSAPQFRRHDLRVNNQRRKVRHDNRTNGGKRNVARNRKTKPGIDYKRKSNRIREGAVSLDPRVTGKDSVCREMETHETWTTKGTTWIWGRKQKEKNDGSVMDQESTCTRSKQLEEPVYTDREMTTEAVSLLHSVTFDRPAEAHNLDIEPSQPFSEPRMNPQSLLKELKQHLMTRSTERSAKTGVPPQNTWKKKDVSDTFIPELKEELSRRKTMKSKAVSLPRQSGKPNSFIDELKERVASRAEEQKHSRPISMDDDQIPGRTSGDLIHELKVTLSNRQKRGLNYDFSAAESKNRPCSRKNQSVLITELRKKLADRHRRVHDLDDRIACVTPSEDNDQQSIEEATIELNSFRHDSSPAGTPDTADHKDLDGNMSTISELGEHSIAFMNPSQFRNPQVEDCDGEKNHLPLVVTTRTTVKQDGDTNNDERDPFTELSRLNQILENDSDNESTDLHVGENEAIDSVSDIEASLEGNSRYPWKSVGDGAMNLRSRQNQMLVFDFVAPGKTPTDRGSADMDLLSRYKDDIMKERRKLQSCDGSVHGGQSISSMPSYKARLFPTKKEKPGSIPWWFPDETDSNTSSSTTVKHHGMIHEIGDNSSTDDNDISYRYGSSSYDATSSTRSSFFANTIILYNKQP